MISFPLEELPKHSDWPARLLRADPPAPARKSVSEVLREFDRDKWGPLLRLVTDNPDVGLAAVERAEANPQNVIPFFERGAFYLAPYGEFLERQFRLMQEALARHAPGASAIVELGAGYGSKIIRLSGMEPFTGLPAHAAEFAPAGRALLALLAEREGLPLHVGGCDFWEGRIDGPPIPENAIVFTSFAAHYVPQLAPSFVDCIARLRPRIVVHFEPCYEHFGSDSLHQLLCRRYIEQNDYTRNLVGLLRSALQGGRISDLREQPVVMGGNPLLPLSILEWK